MCGICGVLGNRLTKFEISIFQDLMLVSSLRGRLGSGMAAVPVKPRKDIEILRSLDAASELTVTKEFFDITKNPMTCLMGHARFPTRGGYTLEETHPHTCGDIIAVHNGTMDVVDGKTVGVTDSDSRMLIRAIADKGLKKALAASKGAYALNVINKDAATISFIRNYERPLVFAKLEDDPSTLYWASESAMLRFVLNRAAPAKTKVKLFELLPDICLTFALRPGHGVLGYIGKEQMLSQVKPTTVPNVPLLPAPPTPEYDPQKQTVMFTTKHGHTVDSDELRVLLASGCAYCERSADMYAYHKGLYWIAKDEFICQECVDTDPTARTYVESTGIRVPDKRN